MHCPCPDNSKSTILYQTNRKNVSEIDEPEGDDFENIYKGEVSKSGVPILPSKRARKVPERIEIFKQTKDKEEIPEDKNIQQEQEVSLDELKEQEQDDESKLESQDSETS